MLLEGIVAEMIVKLDPIIYRKLIWYNKHGKPMLYVQLKKPIWKISGDTTVLEIAIGDATGVEIQLITYNNHIANKDIRRKMHNYMAHR